MVKMEDQISSIGDGQSNLLYQIEGLFIVPMHELIHCYMARWVGQPILMKKDSVYYRTASPLKDFLITVAPTIFSALLIIWAALSFITSGYTYTSWIVLVLQVIYAVWHLSLCRHDIYDVYLLIRYGE